MLAKAADRRILDLGLFSWLATVLSRTFRVLEIHAADDHSLVAADHSLVAAPVLHFEFLGTSPVVAKRPIQGL
jgi:hypothetical protein